MPLTKKKVRWISKVPKVSDLAKTKKVIKATVQAFGDAAVTDVSAGVSFAIRDQAVVDFLANYGGERMTRINKTTQKKIGKLLSTHVDLGSSLGKIKKDLRSMYGLSAKRAADIGVTEITRASNFGSLQGFKQAKIEQKEWLSTEDEAVRDTHVNLNHIIVGINDAFVTVNGRAQYPGDFNVPKEDIHCRCGILPVINDKSMRHRNHWKVFDSKRDPWERRYARALAAAFSVQKMNVIAALDAAWEAA